MSRDDATLLDILKAARLIVEFKGKLNKKAFLRDMKTQKESHGSDPALFSLGSSEEHQYLRKVRGWIPGQRGFCYGSVEVMIVVGGSWTDEENAERYPSVAEASPRILGTSTGSARRPLEL